MELDPQTTALVVVDMQNDFCHVDGYYAALGRAAEPISQAVEPISRLLKEFRAAQGSTVVFTQLLYDSRLPAVEERHQIVPSRWVASDRRLEPGSWGGEIVSALTPSPEDFVLEKTGYSGFSGTGLELLLRRRGITTVVLSGTVSYACVLATAFDAFDRDFDVVVAVDGVSAWFEHLQEAALEIVDLLMGRAISTDDIIAALAAPTSHHQGVTPS